MMVEIFLILHNKKIQNFQFQTLSIDLVPEKFLRLSNILLLSGKLIAYLLECQTLEKILS